MSFKYLQAILIIVSLLSYQSKALTWSECRDLALSNNLTLQEMHQKILKAKTSLEIAETALLPSLDTNLQTSYARTQVKDATDLTVGLSGRQLIFDNNKTNLNIEKSKISLEISKLEYDKELNDLYLKLRQQYIEVIKQQELLAINSNLIKRRKDQYDLIRLRYEAGREHIGAVWEAKANLLEAEIQDQNLHDQLQLYYKQLLQIVNVTTNIEIKDKLQVLSSANLTTSANFMQKHPSYKLTELALANAQKNISLAKLELLPVSIQASAGYQASVNQTAPEDPTWALTMDVSYPLIDWDKQKKEIKNTERQLEIVEMQQESSLLDLRLDLQKKQLAFKNAYQEIAVQKLFLEAAQQRSEVADLQYTNGLVTFDSWMQIDRELAQREKLYVQALAQALSAQAAFIWSKGEGFKHEI